MSQVVLRPEKKGSNCSQPLQNAHYKQSSILNTELEGSKNMIPQICHAVLKKLLERNSKSLFLVK